jgi:hypothetical protein
LISSGVRSGLAVVSAGVAGLIISKATYSKAWLLPELDYLSVVVSPVWQYILRWITSPLGYLNVCLNSPSRITYQQCSSLSWIMNRVIPSIAEPELD